VDTHIADVRLDTAEHFCTDVRTWAESIVRDSEELMQAVSGELGAEHI
jgi:hypothetical protein